MNEVAEMTVLQSNSGAFTSESSSDFPHLTSFGSMGHVLILTEKDRSIDPN